MLNFQRSLLNHAANSGNPSLDRPADIRRGAQGAAGINASAVVSRPFKGRIIGEFEAAPTDTPPLFTAVAHANGLSTQIGRFSKTTSDILNALTGEVTGSFEMTVADGHILRGQYSGYTVPLASTFDWLLNASFTGGTGAYAGATGDFVFIAHGDYYIENGHIYGSYTESFEGSISY